jgi:hypothetical protein
LLPQNHSKRRLRPGLALAAVAAIALVLPTSAARAGSGGIGTMSTGGGGSATVAGGKAKLRNGLAIPPRRAPARVKRAIQAANEIAKGKGYCYGGGHASWHSSCYDCSGSVSYAIGRPGARFLSSPLPSGPLMHWGQRGRGSWITVYANSGHAYAVIAGLRFDTSMTSGNGPGWSRNVGAGKANGPFVARHWHRL